MTKTIKGGQVTTSKFEKYTTIYKRGGDDTKYFIESIEYVGGEWNYSIRPKDGGREFWALESDLEKR